MAVPASFAAVKTHLEQIQRTPPTALDIPLLEKLKAELTQSTDSGVSGTLLVQITQILPALQEDPTPVTTLGIRAAEYLTFADLRSVNPPVDFIAGLKAPSPPVNLLALSLLGKAGQVPSDAAIVAGEPVLVASLIELWLSTSSSTVAQAAFDTIWALLKVDLATPFENDEAGQESQRSGPGQGLMWRRVFADKDVYGFLFASCSFGADGPGHMSKREKTLAQGRLMEFLLKAGRLRWDLVTTSQVPEVEARYRTSSLLYFAACQMVDTSDVLMHMTLLNFLRGLLEIDAPGLEMKTVVHSASSFSSPALDFLVEQKLHSRVVSYYLEESRLDPVDLNYLSGPIMAYVAQYAELYPNHLLQSPQPLLDGILSRINQALEMSPARWAHGPVPAGHLAVLSSLPRVLLVEAGRRPGNPFLALPTSPPCKEVLEALAKILHGPPKPKESQVVELSMSGQTPTDWHREAAAARALYFIYLNNNASLWANVVTAADVLAMKDVSLSAIALMKAIVTANWHVLLTELIQSQSSQRNFSIPSETDLERMAPESQRVLPSSGVWAILTPPALTTLLPYLFKPPRSYAEFAGGGAGDAENAVWKIATAKYEVLVALYDRLKENTAQVEGFEDIVRTLRQRVSEGPWGPVTQTGSRVDAIGM
ncbi:hypothetical protein ASPZODRAFT_23187 [Penicilliopsis zonata CBS 506.65]|uniref:DNA mismatch repair protein HSM3 N-terminal domain-containing protein n=1 Tax=Penicilliopsis zonata CBS 506.65 TaxID=1073090 RepID=A0A1L9SP75_9EURO|nr:hypothetical protein ASPZODRAFT_23187 [Penicilliopsis zonata CBS 506.65]OJJ48903.1 hypothetical protein ASPZODRAFT_23187 [Penicilliopsis zonata CBS 506.65]